MGLFKRGAGAAIMLGLIAALGAIAPLRAAPVTYDFTLTATDIGSPFGGISTVPATFSGSFTVASPLAANLSKTFVALSDFALTIGTESWNAASLVHTPDQDFQSVFSTDSLGKITDMSLVTYQFGGDLYLAILQNVGGFVNWFAVENGCTLQNFGDGTISSVSGHCIGGDPGSVTITERVEVSDVPEPTTLALFSAGLVGVALTRRRREAV